MPSSTFNIPDSSTEAFDKDIEIQSSETGSKQINDTETDIEDGRIVIEGEKDEAQVESIRGIGRELGTENWNGGKGGGLATRISTKSSWKDPGPPPDGGWSGWTQGKQHSHPFIPLPSPTSNSFPNWKN